MQPQSALRRKLFQISWPIIIAQSAVMANGIVDTMMAGRLSAEDIAAVGIGSSIYATIFVTFMGILLALPPIISHHEGAGRQLEIGADIRQSFWLTLILMVIGMLLLSYPDPLLELAAPSPLVAQKVHEYLSVIKWGLPAFLFFRIFYGFTSGIGHTRPVMFFNLLGLALKVPLNGVFMLGWGDWVAPYGAVGAAYATTLSGIVVCLLAWGTSINQARYTGYQVFSFFEWPTWRAQWDYLRLGLPIGFSLLIDVSSFTLMAIFIARLGAVSSAAHQIASSVAIALFMIPVAIGQAVSVLIGLGLGAKKQGEAKMLGMMGLRFGMVISLSMTLLMLMFAPAIASIFTHEIEVHQLAVGIIRVVGVYHLADAFQMIGVQILRGYKRTLVPTLIYTVALWGVGLAGGYVLALTSWIVPPMGVVGFWWASALGLGLSGIAFYGYWRHIS